MKRLVYFATISCSIILNSCTLPQMIKMAKNQNLTVSPSPLEVHKDTVSFELSANLPMKMLKPNTQYTLNTFYKFGDQDQEQALEPVTFKSNDFPQSYSREPRQTRKFSFPYDPKFKSGILQVQGVASRGTKSKSTPRLDVATGLITTSKLVKDSYYVAFADAGYNSQDEIVPLVIPNFVFEQGSAELNPTEASRIRNSHLDAFLVSNNMTQSVTISGGHSPEGREEINSELAQKRAGAIEKFYREEMRKYDYKNEADKIQFNRKPESKNMGVNKKDDNIRYTQRAVINDWSGFKSALAGYAGISTAEKQEYLNIINEGGTFPDVEKRLSKLGSYQKVSNELYPGLRAAKTEILVMKKKKSEMEIVVLAKQILNGQAESNRLSLEEFLYAASLTPSLEEKAKYYEAATKMGTSWVAHNNLAATWLSLGIQYPDKLREYAENASTQLEIASRLRTANEVFANLTTVALIQGNPYKTITLAEKALNGASGDITRGINGVKAAAEIRTGKYAKAVESLSDASGTAINQFNRGLAQLLNKEYKSAYSSFLESAKTDKNLGLAYYGAAVAAARQGNEKDLIAQLSMAVQTDSNLKESALSDLEFGKWAGTDAFRNALK